MSLYKRTDTDGNLITPYWYCEFEVRDNDTGEIERVRRSTDVEIATSSVKAEEKSKAKARGQQALIKQSYIEEKRKGTTPERKEITFQDWATIFQEKVIPVDYRSKENTAAFYMDRAKALLRYKPLASCLLSRIDSELLDGYRLFRASTTKTYGLRKAKGKPAVTADTFRPTSLATLHRDLTVLRRMIRRARDWKYQVPAEELHFKIKLKAEKKRDRLVSKVEEAQYLAAAPELLRDFAVIALNTGLRPDSELLALRWENISFSAGTIYIPEGKSDAAKRTLQMTGAARSIFIKRHNAAGKPVSGYVFPGETDQPLPYSVIDTQHDRLMEILKWSSRACIYDFRHTALTRFYYTGMGIKDLAKIAGHSDIRMTERYIKGNEAHVREAFKRFEQYTEMEEKPKAKRRSA
jgi:integrase